MAKKAKLLLMDGLQKNDENNSVPIEIRLYLEFPIIGDNEPLDWWNENQERFPYLSKLAEVHLAIPSTSAASESAFSTAGNMMIAKRSSLIPSKLNMLCFIHDNYNTIGPIEI